MLKLYVLIPVALNLALHLHIATVTADNSLFSSFSQLSGLTKEFKQGGFSGLGGHRGFGGLGSAESPTEAPSPAEGPSPGGSGSKFSLSDFSSLTKIKDLGNLAKDFKSQLDGSAPSPSSDADADAPSPSSDADAPSPSSDADAPSPSSDAGSTSSSSGADAPSPSTTELEVNPLTSDDDNEK